MHADMRTLAENSTVRRVPVSDAVSKPVTQGGVVQPAPSAAPTAAPTPSGERPRHIILPPIDKAAADREAASAGQKSAGPVAAKSETRPEAKPEAKPAAKASVHAAPAPAESAEERRTRELQYATSGPRKTAKRKPAVEHAASAPAPHPQAHWAYDGEGAPANWARLNPDYAACASGRRQSPIDIRDGIKLGLEAIQFDYKPTQARIVDNGHTLQVNVGEGLALQIMGKRYELLQFHFHRPAEERVNGRAYDMVAHLVHRNDEGQLAVVAVLLEKGGENPLIQTLWNNMPLERDMETSPAGPLDLMQLLPENRSYWIYMGSLTTPPCTEGVLWMVMKQPMQVSAEQVAIFSRLNRNNARPVQPANGRLIKESR
jgi:carbonic anhydrase